MHRLSWESFSGSPAMTHRTSKPVSRSMAAMPMPSPPLLPLPESTSTRPPAGSIRRISAAAPAAARSISSSPGMPRVSMA